MANGTEWILDKSLTKLAQSKAGDMVYAQVETPRALSLAVTDELRSVGLSDADFTSKLVDRLSANVARNCMWYQMWKKQNRILVYRRQDSEQGRDFIKVVLERRKQKARKRRNPTEKH